MPNKDRSFHEVPEKAGVEGWLYSEQQQKLCHFKPNTATVHAQWVAIRTYHYVPPRPPAQMTWRRMLRHNAIEAWETPQDGPEGLSGNGGWQLELIPSRHQVKGGAVDRHGLQSAGIGFFFHSPAGVRLALGDAELGFAVVVGGNRDERHLQGADTKHPADLDDVAPRLREQPD